MPDATPAAPATPPAAPAAPAYQPAVTPTPVVVVPPPTPNAAPPLEPVATPPPAKPAEPAAPAAPAAPVVPPVPAPQPPPPKPPEPAKPAAPVPAADAEFTVPAEAKLDPADVESFKTIAKAEGLTSKQAQALVDMRVKQNEQAQKAFSDAVQRQRAADLDALKADKDFGGIKFEKSVADARSAAKQFGGEEFSKLVEAAGLDQHPAFVKAFARVRAAIAEDSTSSRVPNPGSVETNPKPRPGTITERLAARYDAAPKTR